MKWCLSLVTLSVACATSPVAPPPPSTQLVTIGDSTVSFTIDVLRGGAIVDLRAEDSGNIVDNGDATGRQIQAALYDGTWSPDFWPCPGGTLAQWGNDPVQAGNACETPSGGQVLSQSPLTTQTTPLQWNASLGRSTMDLVQTLTIVAPGVLKIDYRVTNLGMAEFGADNWQEMPGAYFDARFSTAWYMSTGVLTSFGATHAGANDLRPLTTSEPWIALTRDDGWAVALVLPGHLTPWALQLGGGGDKPASFLDALQWLHLAPGQTQTNTAWVVVGRSLDEVRARIRLIL